MKNGIFIRLYMGQKLISAVVLSLALAILLSACGGSADSVKDALDSNATESDGTTTDNILDATSDCPLGGAAVKGVINAATVTIYTVDATGANETTVGTATTDKSGDWSAAPKPCADDGIYRVEVTDGTYTSEATKGAVTNTVSYSALVDTGSVDISGSAESLAITPVSTFIDERAANILALSKIGFGKGRYAAVANMADAIATATTEVMTHFGLTKNPLTIDVNINDATAVESNPEGTKLGIILGAMTEQAKDFADPGNFIEALINDFADGTFDGLDASGVAITVSDPTAGDTTLVADAGTTGFTTALADYTAGTDNAFSDSGIVLSDVSDIVSDITTGIETTVAATAYSSADLNGTWNYGTLFSPLTGDTIGEDGWAVGVVTLDPDGSLTDTCTTSSRACEADASAPSGTLAMTSSGQITMLDFNLFMNASKDVIVQANEDVNEQELSVSLKRADSYSSADLDGTWNVVTLSSPLTDNTIGVDGWGVGIINFNPDGSVTASCTTSSTACFADLSLPPGTLAINSTGRITPMNMFMNAGKDVIVQLHTDSGNEQEFLVAVKSADSYSLADLSGTWNSVELFSPLDGNANGENGYEVAVVTLDPDGSLTYTCTTSSRACEADASAPPGTLAITSSGQITMLDFNLFMNAGKDVIVHAGEDANEQSLGVWLKRAE